MTSKRWREAWDDFTLWLELQGFQPEVPFRGITGNRRYRWDYACDDLKVAVEYQGRGVGHQSFNQTDRDHEKLNQAQVLGWIVIQCGNKSLEDGRCHCYVERAIEIRRASIETQ